MPTWWPSPRPFVRPWAPLKRFLPRGSKNGCRGGGLLVEDVISDRLAARLFKQEGARLEVVADRSVFIENSLREVQKTAVIGGLLAVLVLFLFLNDFKSTLIVAVSIPMSVIMTFAPLNLSEVTLNIMSLGGLALGVGMLVDSSIVVLESIYRCRQEGDTIKLAAVRGAREVRGAVTASTLTSIAVFLPMVFVEGIAGQVFGDLGITVVVSLLASLLVAVYFIPMLASRQALESQTRVEPVEKAPHRWVAWQAFAGLPQVLSFLALGVVALRCLAPPFGMGVGMPGKRSCRTHVSLIFAAWVRGLWPLMKTLGGALMSRPVVWTQALIAGLQQRYQRLLHTALDRPITVFTTVCLSLLLTGWAISQLDSELLPEVHQSEVTFELQLPVGTPLEETVRVLGQVEAKILEDVSDIETVLTTFGYDITNMKRSDEGEHSARFKLLLRHEGHPVETENRVLERIRALLVDVPDLRFRVTRPVLSAHASPLVWRFMGMNWKSSRSWRVRPNSCLASQTPWPTLRPRSDPVPRKFKLPTIVHGWCATV